MRSFALTLALLAVAASAHAQSKTGTTMAQFLNIEPNARHTGMGNAGTALTGSIESVYFNTGVIGSIDRPSVMFTHSEWFAGITYQYAAGAVPVGNLGTVFASLTALNSGEIDVRTVDDPQGTGQRYTVTNTALAVGYGKRITSRFTAGIQINYVNEKIWNTSESVFTLSVGTQYRLTESGARLGFGLSNMGTRGQFTGRDLAIQYDQNPDAYGDNSALPGSQFTGEFQVPIMFRIGVAYPYEISKNNVVMLVADALNPNDNTESVNFGGEWTLNQTLMLRAGYQTLFQEDSEQGLTLGFGLHGDWSERDYRFDYAWATHDHLDATHRFTVALEF